MIKATLMCIATTLSCILTADQVESNSFETANQKNQSNQTKVYHSEVMGDSVISCIKLGMVKTPNSFSSNVSGEEINNWDSHTAALRYRELVEYFQGLYFSKRFREWREANNWTCKLLTEDELVLVKFGPAYGNKEISRNDRLDYEPVLFPLLNNNPRNYATVASFRELEDASFRAVPEGLREKYLEFRRDDTNRGHPVVVARSDIGAQLEKVFGDRLYAYTCSTKTEVRLQTFEFMISPEWGSDQIGFTFSPSVNEALFVSAQDAIDVTRIVSENSDLNFPDSIIALPVDGGSLSYYANTEDHGTSFEILRDNANGRILYLKFASNYCLGNESGSLLENYLLVHEGKRLVLRMADRFSCIVTFESKSVPNTLVIGDESAPDL